MSTTRRRFLQGSAALAAGLAGCSSKSRRGLRVFVYAGGHEATMRAEFVPAFEAETGATVTLYPGWWDGMAKLKAAPAGDPPFDLMITDATQGFPAAREGLFARLDWSKIPNKQHLASAALDHWVTKEGHGLTYPDSVMTFAYSKSRAKEPPAKWGDLLRPEFSGKLGLYNNYYMSLYTVACILAEQGGNAASAHDLIATKLDDVFRLAKEIRPRVKLWWQTSTDMILALANGDCSAGNMHSPEYIQALREKPDLGAAVPETNRAFVQVFWAIPAGSPNRDLAHHALNLLFSEGVQLGFARRGLAATRLDVAKQVAAEDPFWKRLYPHTEGQFAAIKYYPYDTYANYGAELGDRWDRVVLRGN